MTTYKILELSQKSDDWLTERARRITATDLAALRSGRKSLYQLLAEKTGRCAVPDLSDIPGVKAGIHFEPLVRQYLSEHFKEWLPEGATELPNPCVVRVDHDFYMASLDGLTAQGIVIEIKNCFTATDFEAIKEQGLQAPKVVHYGYFAQLQWQMYVTGAPYAIIVFHHSETQEFGQIAAFKVDRNEEEISTLLKLASTYEAAYRGETELKPDPEKDFEFISDNDVSDLGLDGTLDELRRLEAMRGSAARTLQLISSRQNELKELLSNAIFASRPPCKGVKAPSFTLTKCVRENGYDIERMVQDGLITKDQLEGYKKPASAYVRVSL